MRMAYRGGIDEYELRSILPASPRCNARTESLIVRLRLLFEESISEKAMNVLSQAHMPVFMKVSEFTMKLMMTGVQPPPPLPDIQPGFPHPVLDYLNKVVMSLGSIGSKIGAASLEGHTFEEVNSWLDAMESLPAS